MFKFGSIDPEKIELQVTDSLQKIFTTKKNLILPPLTQLTALRGERISFQIAYRYTEDYLSSQMLIQASKLPSVRIRTVSDQAFVHVRKVGYVPSLYPCNAEVDDDYLTIEPGLFPDPLEEIRDTLQLIPYAWRALWVTAEIPEDAPSGNSEIQVLFEDLNGKTLRTVSLPLTILEEQLPKQELIHTEWFHSDCLADYYHVPVFSEEYWKVTEEFMKTAVSHGINMILTPIIGVTLDTLIGRHRTHVQLCRVVKLGPSYIFDFSNFDRWIMLAKKCGYQYFEMSHLFSQWGAKYACPVMIMEDGKEFFKFDWHTASDDPEYLEFLHQFLPALCGRIRMLGIADSTFFHISDEPNEYNEESYLKAASAVRKDLEGFPMLDALSTLDIFKQGIVDRPIPTNQHIHEFLDAGFTHPWVYYCCGEYIDVSNRFFAMPSYRNRILGVQLYLYQIEGFLHWGYNFYNSQYSLRHLNPYSVTDADDSFPSGDSYLVYPGENGKPVESIRLLVLEQGLQDLRALKLLEAKKGRDFVVSLIDRLAGMHITFSSYPKNSAFLLNLREEVYRNLSE